MFINPDISKAHTLDKRFYLDDVYFEQAKDKIFARSWQYAADQAMTLVPGSALPFTLLDGYLNEPLIIVRDKAGMARCLSNVCTHRGNILVKDPCTNLRQLSCNYHGRCFNLDGSMSFMPGFEGVANFPAETDNLPKLPLLEWCGMLFTSLNRDMNPLDYFGDMQDRIGWLPLDKLTLRQDLSKDYIVNAHWALYCENYLEGFHIPYVHPSLHTVLDSSAYTTEVFRYANLQVGIAGDEDICFDIPPGAPDYGKRIAAYYFWVFPNMMFNFYPWGLSFNLVQPLTKTSTRVSFMCYVYDASKLNTGAGNGLDQVELEDEAVVENVQRGIQSRLYRHGRYSAQHEKGTHHFHRLIAEAWGH